MFTYSKKQPVESSAASGCVSKPYGRRRQQASRALINGNYHHSQSEPLGSSERATMEQRLGQSFASVRVHRDEASHKLTELFDARAFTFGEHVYFRRGEFSPGAERGQRLLEHELVHVLQQRRSQKPIVARWPWSDPKPHTSDDLGSARIAFEDKNDHLSEEQLRKIAAAVTKVASNAST
ncbi:MAG TPA: DUF4157 domain-containing protein, partial [Polyangiaceae bacterium]